MAAGAYAHYLFPFLISMYGKKQTILGRQIGGECGFKFLGSLTGQIDTRIISERIVEVKISVTKEKKRCNFS